MMFSRLFMYSMWDTPMLVIRAQVGFTTSGDAPHLPGHGDPHLHHGGGVFLFSGRTR